MEQWLQEPHMHSHKCCSGVGETEGKRDSSFNRAQKVSGCDNLWLPFQKSLHFPAAPGCLLTSLRWMPSRYFSTSVLQLTTAPKTAHASSLVVTVSFTHTISDHGNAEQQSVLTPLTSLDGIHMDQYPPTQRSARHRSHSFC